MIARDARAIGSPLKLRHTVEIHPRVHLIPGVVANPYLIIDDDGLTLIDAGLRGSEKKILDYITKRGYSARDLRRIVITHADPDHVGGLDKLRRLTGARVYASQIESAAIARGRRSRELSTMSLPRRLLGRLTGVVFKIKPVRVDEVIGEGSTLPVLGGLQVIDTPGHTPGHISLFASAAGILFTGDSIVSRGGRLVGSLPGLTWDADKAAASVRRQALLAPTLVCPGHGPVVDEAAGKMPAA